MTSSFVDSPGQVRTTFEGAVATVTLSQPARLNAITVAMWRELSRTFAALAENDGCRVVIVTGAGQQFSAGADRGRATLNMSTSAFPPPSTAKGPSAPPFGRMASPDLDTIACRR